MRSTIIFSLGLILLLSCRDDFEERVRVETVPAFNVIRLQSVFTVILRNDDEYSVTITADDDVINEIELKSVNDTLLFLNHSNGKLMNPERNKVAVEIAAPSFHTFISEDSYSLSTAGTLNFDQLFIWNYPEVKVSDINMHLNGNLFFYWNNWLAGGKLTLSGNSTTTVIRNDALHIVDATELISAYTTVNNYGRENCEVVATTQLQYSLNGPGNIIVHGNPSELILVEKTSTGQLIVAD